MKSILQRARSTRSLLGRLRPAPSVIGLDLGSTCIRAACIDWVGDEPHCQTLVAQPLPEDGASDAARFDEAVDQTLSDMLARGVLPHNRVTTFLWSSDVRVRVLNVPPMPEAELAETLRYEIAREEEVDPEAIVFDAVPLGEVILRGTPKLAVLAMIGFRADLEAHVARMRRIGLEPVAIDDVSLSLARVCRLNLPADDAEAVSVVHTGLSMTEFAILVGGEVRYCRPLAIGGREILDTLAKRTGVPIEMLLESRSHLVEGNLIDLDTFDEAVTTFVDQLMSEIQRAFSYFSFQLSQSSAELTRIAVSGNFPTPDVLQSRLASRFDGIRVEVLDPLSGLNGLSASQRAEFEHRAAELSVAVGLALRRDFS